jgi:hypothetical protein
MSPSRPLANSGPTSRVTSPDATAKFDQPGAPGRYAGPHCRPIRLVTEAVENGAKVDSQSERSDTWPQETKIGRGAQAGKSLGAYVGGTVIVRRAAIAGAIILTAVFATANSLPASTRLAISAAVPSKLPAKTKKPLTKKQYIAQANALCDAAGTAVTPIRQRLGQSGGSPTAQQIAAVVKALAPIVQHQIDKTRALQPPKSDQSKVKKILSAEQQALNKVKADPQVLGTSPGPFFTADTLARAYGLEDAAGTGTCTGGGGSGQSGGSQSSGGTPPASAATPST